MRKTISLPTGSKEERPKQWLNLVGKRCELRLKDGTVVIGNVASQYAHTLKLSDCRVKIRGAETTEIFVYPVNIDCQSIVVAIEMDS